jgi:(E)-4-hydroxy-3-methylbut-2-enyl-diphosphate synthase
VNAGSLASDVAARDDLTLAEKMLASARGFVEHFEQRGFKQLVLASKAHDVLTTVDAYRRLSAELPHIPLHLGVTEAGTEFSGTVKSAIGIGSLLMEGIGDTLRVSLTAPPLHEVRVAWEILAASDLRHRHAQLVSCPTCGRCEVDLIGIAKEVDARLQDIAKPLTVAVMGCVVNGPGEAAGADVGVACGRGQGAIFRGGEVLYTVAEDQIITALFEEIEKWTGDGSSVHF